MVEGAISRRRFVIGGASVLAAGALALMAGCSATGTAAGASGSAGAATSGETQTQTAAEKITMVWLPDNSSADLTSSRQAIGDAIKTACGAEVELMTTTDYNVAIEAIASGSAQKATCRRTRRTLGCLQRSPTAMKRAASMGRVITAAFA